MYFKVLPCKQAKTFVRNLFKIELGTPGRQNDKLSYYVHSCAELIEMNN